MTLHEIPKQGPRPIISGEDPRLMPPPASEIRAARSTYGDAKSVKKGRLLDPELVPSRLIDPADRKPIVIRDPKDISRFHMLDFVRIVLKWAASMLLMRVAGRLSRAEYARSFRQLLERLGGLWVKAGQLLSLRTDLFSEEFCEELSKLQYEAVGFPPSIAKQIIEEDLGGPLEEFFDQFDEKPFAAASIGQIHRAHLRKEDVWVAVKVQRPEMPESFIREVTVIRTVVRLLQRSGIAPYMRWEGMLWELTQILKEEINYNYEAGAMRRMRKNLRKHGIYVPKIFSRYCTPRVLVMEFVPGILMSDYIQVKLNEPGRLEAWITENDVDPEAVAKRLIRSLFRQLLEDNLYHGDLHPGNIILLRKNKIALIDFGSIGFTDREFLHKFRLSVRALATRDYEKAADLTLLLCPPLPRIDLELVKEQIIRALRAWATRTFIRELPYHEKSVGNASDEMLKVLYAHKIPLDWAYLRIRRAITTLDASLIHLYPTVNYVKLTSQYFRAAEDRNLERLSSSNSVRGMLNGLSAFQDIGERMSEYSMFRASLIRRHAQLFDGATSKASNFFAVVCWNIALILLVGGFVNLSIFANQYYPEIFRSVLGTPPEGFYDVFPRLPYTWWIVAMVLDFYFFSVFLRLTRRFREKDARMMEAGVVG
jgi:ubiquinone biosynthesis protein